MASVTSTAGVGLGHAPSMERGAFEPKKLTKALETAVFDATDFLARGISGDITGLKRKELLISLNVYNVLYSVAILNISPTNQQVRIDAANTARGQLDW